MRKTVIINYDTQTVDIVTGVPIDMDHQTLLSSLNYDGACGVITTGDIMELSYEQLLLENQ